ASANVQGTKIDLIAHGGSIGASDHDFKPYGAGEHQQDSTLQIQASIDSTEPTDIIGHCLPFQLLALSSFYKSNSHQVSRNRKAMGYVDD
ncbi:MAG TPA: hypothetical protein VIJ25_12920, partial [Methylococcales bacterium]